MRLEAVPADALAEAWHHAEKWLGRPWRHETDQTMDDMRQMCAAGEGLLILVRDEADECRAVVITQLLDRVGTAGRTLWLVACAGDGIAEWAPLLAEIEAGARLHGADRVEFTGRAGWARFLPGYRAETRYTKDLV